MWEATVEFWFRKNGTTNDVTIFSIGAVKSRDWRMMGYLFRDEECPGIVFLVRPHAPEHFTDNRVVWFLQALSNLFDESSRNGNIVSYVARATYISVYIMTTTTNVPPQNNQKLSCQQFLNSNICEASVTLLELF